MPTGGGLASAAIARLAWGEAYERLRGPDPDELEVEDLVWLATAAYLTGRDDAAVAAWEAAHKRHLAAGDPDEAARCAFWTAFCLMMRGQMAHAGGWLSRAQSLVEGRECTAAGFLLVPAVLQALDGGEAEQARELAVRAGEIARRSGDPDLAAFATLGHGQALLALGDEPGGLARLDEVMVAVTSGDVGPIASGIVYCAVILECMQIFDLARAAEWTAALDGWCRRQPDLVPYRGQCLVHRAQIEQASGDWAAARSNAGDACTLLADPPHPALGLACYQRGELQRLSGHLEDARAAYTEASRFGFEPMPGLALLDLARGEHGAAAAGISRALHEATEPFRRPALLAAAVDIFLAAGDPTVAATAAEELTAIAGRARSEVLAAMADQAVGATRLAAGAAHDALGHLRAAGAAWQRSKMPYEAARTAALIGHACLALGDRSSAAVSFDHAREVFASLGAAPDLARIPALSEAGASEAGGLTAREREVLALVAAGMTNPEIAAELTISRHTVGRHLENVFAKLGVNSRAAAIAAAYDRRLI